MKSLTAHNRSLIIALLFCYICSIFSFTCTAQSPRTGLQNVIAQLQLLSDSNATDNQIETAATSGIATRLLYTTAEIICTQQSDSGEQQQSLIVQFDYSHLLPVKQLVFTPAYYIRQVDSGNESPQKMSLLPEIPPPKSIV